MVGGGAGLGKPESFARLAAARQSALDAAAVVSPTASAAQLAGPAGLSLLGHINADPLRRLRRVGSERHLASLPPWTRVIVVNTDPSARIVQIAERALIADADRTLEELLAELAPSGDE